ncbi:MAG: DUF106 domain-containing protein [Nitrosarchaeum sp.]|nr:DUF106 domain-containing protein [Nitrosarchaeum sp.]
MVEFLNPVLDPVLGPFLTLDPALAIGILSIVISFLITLAYKYLTDQARMRALKAEMKSLQKELRSSKDDPQRMMQIQQKLMPLNMEYMRHSFRPTLFTMLPILLIFGWLNTHMAYYNIEPGEVFAVEAVFQEGASGNVSLDVRPELEVRDGVVKRITQGEDGPFASWSLSGDAGEYVLEVGYGSGDFRQSHEAKLVIAQEREYEPPVVRVRDAPLREIRIGNRPVKPLGSLSIFGWDPGWLGTYILFSIAASILIRKVLKVS